MTPEENARRMREAIAKTGWTPPQPQPAQPSWAALASNPALAVGLQFDLGNKPLERFARGLLKPLPDNAVPDFAKPAQSALAAPEGSWRRGFSDWMSRPQDITDSLSPFGGGNQAMIRQALGKVIGDPVKGASEMLGYAPATRAFDAGALALEEEDPVAAAGQWARSLGEGGMAAATVAGNAYGLGSLGAKAYRGGPVAALPDAEMAGLKGRLAKAQTAGPTQIQSMIDDAGARAAAAEARIKPVDWSQVDMPEPAVAAAPQAPRDWTINIEGRTAPGRPMPRPGTEPDAYTPFALTPEEQAAIDLSRANQGRTSMWDQPSLAPDAPRAPGALTPLSAEQKAAMNAELERLAWAADDADKAGNPGGVAKAHEDIASIMARTGKPLETSPRLQAIQDRIDAIDRELKTADGAWREEELLAEADALMNERRTLRGKAPRQGALGDSTTLGMSGGNLFDDGGPSIAESIAEWARGLGKKSMAANDQSLGFRLSESEPWEAKPPIYRDGRPQTVAPANEGPGPFPAGSPEDVATWAPDLQGYRGALDTQRRRGALEAVEGGGRRGEQIGRGRSKDVFANPDDPNSVTVQMKRNAPQEAFLDFARDAHAKGLPIAQHLPDPSPLNVAGDSVTFQTGKLIPNTSRLRIGRDENGFYLTGLPDDHPQRQALIDAVTELDAHLKRTLPDSDHYFDLGPQNFMLADDGRIIINDPVEGGGALARGIESAPPSSGPTILGSNGGNLGAEGGALSRRTGQAPWVDERGLIPALKKLAEENGGKLPNGYANTLSEQFQMPAQTVRSRVARLRESNADIQKIAPQREFNRTDLTDRDVMLGIADGERTIDIAADFNASRNSVNAKAKAMENAIRKRLANGEDKAAIANEYGVTDDVLDAFLRPRKTGPKAANKVLGAGLIAGTTYLPARLAADFAADQQEEGALPAWMMNLPRDPVPARPGL